MAAVKAAGFSGQLVHATKGYNGIAPSELEAGLKMLEGCASSEQQESAKGGVDLPALLNKMGAVAVKDAKDAAAERKAP